jgi:hypothetical protein
MEKNDVLINKKNYHYLLIKYDLEFRVCICQKNYVQNLMIAIVTGLQINLYLEQTSDILTK